MIDLAQVHKAKCEDFNRQCYELLMKLVACRPEEKIKGQRDKEEILVMLEYIDNVVLCILGFIALYWIVIGIHVYIFPLLSGPEDDE